MGDGVWLWRREDEDGGGAFGEGGWGGHGGVSWLRYWYGTLSYARSRGRLLVVEPQLASRDVI